MYVLRPIEALRHPTEQAVRRIHEAKQLLKDSSEGLTFEPNEHRYFLGNREMECVSSVVERFAPFDAPAKAAASSKNPRHPLFGHPVEEILALWEENRDRAAAAGTAVHEFGEACYAFLIGDYDKIPEEFKERLTSDGLVAESPKETAAAMWWASQNWENYAIVAKETRIVNPTLDYAGTFDLLLYENESDGFILKDYKTNEDLFKWYKEMLLPPLSMIKQNDVGKYTVQQNMYAIELKNIGLKVIESDLIWLKENEYQEVMIDLGYMKLIEYAVANRKRNNIIS